MEYLGQRYLFWYYPITAFRFSLVYFPQSHSICIQLARGQKKSRCCHCLGHNNVCSIPKYLMSSNRGETRSTHGSTVSHHPHHRQSLGTGLGEMHQQRRSHRDDQENLAGC